MDLKRNVIRTAGTVVTAMGDTIRTAAGTAREQECRFRRWGGGEAYTELPGNTCSPSVKGTVSFLPPASAGDRPPAAWKGSVHVTVEVMDDSATDNTPENGHVWDDLLIRAWVRRGGGWQEVPAIVAPVLDQLFDRFRGLLESDALSGKCVVLWGLGSVGSPIAEFLAQSGVDTFGLVDDDRVELCNVPRHTAGVSDLGRYKTSYVRDRILQKNPYATVHTYRLRLNEDTYEEARRIVREGDVHVCSFDNQPGRLRLNRLCVEEEKTLILAGAFRRAYGAQILRIRPFESFCYQCFLKMVPRARANTEVASPEQAVGIGYSDVPVAVEPGLSVDLAPCNHMAAKLVIQELLKDRETTFRNLDEDLSASWYLFLNRREPGTEYEGLEPLGCGIDGFRVMRWYGVDVDRDRACPVCGDIDATRASMVSNAAGLGPDAARERIRRMGAKS